MSHNETTAKINELIVLCDRLIKAGKIAEVSAILKKVSPANVPRSCCQSLAKICRRAGLIAHGLRILHPIIRHEKSQLAPATASEVCEYSALLSRNGSADEALELLESVDPQMHPEALLYSGYCHILNWDYAQSVHFFQKFLASNADEYSQLIARVNLASSYIITDELSKADSLLIETVSLLEKAGAARLVGNCYELWGQVHFWRDDFSKAREALEQASKIFGESMSYDQLLIYKTQSIMTALEKKSLEPLKTFRKDAIERRHWESVRDADLFSLKIRFQQKKLDHLYFGTPSSAYRQRIQKVIGKYPSSSYVFGSDSSTFLDLQTGRISGKIKLNPGKKIHQVLACLTQDFYVPRNLGSLFSELYPNEFFHINSSPYRVRQLIQRTRDWLEESQIPASIEQSAGRYQLSIQKEFGIRLSLESSEIDRFAVKWNELKSSFGQRSPFTAEEACHSLGISRTAFRRIVDWASEKGEIQKAGNGRATIYHLSPSSQPSCIKKAS